MKIISSFMDDLIIRKGVCHSIVFESTRIQMHFRQLLRGFFNRDKSKEFEYINIINSRGDSIKCKEFYFIEFDCQSISLRNEKSTNKVVQDLLRYQLENNPQFLEEYIKLNTELERFISEIELKSDDLTIEFEMSDNLISNIIKSFVILFEYEEEDYVPNYIIRKFLLESLLQLNVTNKEVFLLFSFPEVDIGFEDYPKVVEYLKKLNITTLIITTHSYFSRAANQMFLINRSGALYDIINLGKELVKFDLVNQDQESDMSKFLAYKDFTGDYDLLDSELKNFLLSNRF